METQQVNAQVSLLSKMNAFYGIPNQSQETAIAVQQGAPAPEVYSSKDNQPPQTTTEDKSGATTSPVESFFTEATEQVEISNQAVVLQQQSQAVNEPTAQSDSTANTPPETAATTTPASNNPNSGPAPASGNNNGPAATSALNTEAPAPTDNNEAANALSDQANAPVAATGAGYNSNAVQPGALFSALG